MIFERLRALRACFPSIFSGGRLSNCDITYLKDLFYRGVPPFQFPLPQVTTWKLLDGRNHCSENIHKIFQEFYNTLVVVYFAFSPMHWDFKSKYWNTSRKYFSGEIISSDGVLVDGGDRPSWRFSWFYTQQLAILVSESSHKLNFFCGNIFLLSPPVDLLALPDPI